MQINNAFFEELGVSPEVTALVMEVTERVADKARSTAPADTEDYKNGIEVRMKKQKRSVGLVVGTDPKTLLIEAKTGNLVRALRSVK